MILFSLGLLFGLSRLHLAVLLPLAFAAVDDGEVESRLGGARVKDDRQPGIWRYGIIERVNKNCCFICLSEN